MSTDVQNALSKLFIQRKDVYASQSAKGEYFPTRSPWSRELLAAHIDGKRSLGHYLVDPDGQTKVFAFDIDLVNGDRRTVERTGRQPTWLPIDESGQTVQDADPKPLDPRAAWLHPKAPPELRRFLTAQLMGVANDLANHIVELIEMPVAVTYSGSKGVHVYCFCGPCDAADAQAAALEVIHYTGRYEALRGKCFFRHQDDSPSTGFGCVDVEVFPKQTSLDGKDLGNLMRLPLGVNTKSGQRSHFLSLNSHVDVMTEMDALTAMEGNPWA